MFNLPFSIIFVMVFGVEWGLLIFSTLGILIGLLGYQTFKNDEYYAYHNLGFTKLILIKKVFMLNLIPTSVGFLIFLIFR